MVRITQENLRKPLSKIIMKRRGYVHELGISPEYYKSFRSFGFINTGRTLKYDTYSVTKIADNYYKDIYGAVPYYMLRIRGFINRLFFI